MGDDRLIKKKKKAITWLHNYFLLLFIFLTNSLMSCKLSTEFIKKLYNRLGRFEYKI